MLSYDVSAQNSYCITYDFEKDFEILFNQDHSTCRQGFDMWTLGLYSEISVPPAHPSSTSFMKPLGLLSCISSFEFPVQSGSFIEVNGFADPRGADFINIMVQQNIGDDVPTIAQYNFQPTSVGHFSIKFDISAMASAYMPGYVCFYIYYYKTLYLVCINR